MLARVGVPRVQLALLPLLESPEDWCDAVRVLSDCGVRVVSGMFQPVGEDYSTLETIKATGGVRSDETWPQSLDRALRTADLAAASGIALVTFHAGFIPHDAGAEREKILKRLRTLADHFAQRGIQLALETGQETAETLANALAELDRPSVGVNFDPANMILYGMGDPVEAVQRLLPRVVQVHIKDAVPTAVRGEWGDEVPVGQGAVAWGRFLKVIASSPTPLDLVIEREAGACREADITAARELIQREWR